MAGRRNAKRALKRVKRESEEAQTVIQQLMMICSHHGRVVNFPWELPNLFQELLVANEQGHGEPTRARSPRSGTSKQQSLDRLSEFADMTSLDLAALADQQGGEAPVPSPPPIQGQPRHQQRAHTAPPEPPPMSMEEMQAQVEAATQRLAQRVEQNGVRYKFGEGPAAGKKMSMAENIPGQKRRHAAPTTPPQAPSARQRTRPSQEDPPVFDEDFSDLGTVGPAAQFDHGWEDEDDDDGSDIGHYGPPDHSGSRGPVNRATGMALEDARELIARVTGKRPAPPGGNPVMKPPT